jgi:predicted transcriptional regulator
VRATLRILEQKGHARHEEQGPRYLYSPTVPREKARRRVMRDMLKTFFENSTEDALAAMLDVSSSKLSAEEYDRLADLIARARKDGK